MEKNLVCHQMSKNSISSSLSWGENVSSSLNRKTHTCTLKNIFKNTRTKKYIQISKFEFFLSLAVNNQKLT